VGTESPITVYVGRLFVTASHHAAKNYVWTPLHNDGIVCLSKAWGSKQGAPFLFETKENTMKPRILITAMAALAFAVFAVPEAQGKSGPDVDQRLSGGVFNIDVDEEGNTTSLTSMLAKGAPGKADVSGVIVFGPPLGLDGRCPDEFPYGSNLIRLEWAETFNDGSVLSGAASDDQAVCSDGLVNVIQVMGPITGGTGRFEGASGTWEVDAGSPLTNNSVTGAFTADLD